MPIIGLIKRLVVGRPLTPSEHDSNLTLIESAIDAGPAEHAETHEAGGSDELRSKFGSVQVSTNSNNVVLPASDIVWISSTQNVVISGFVCVRPQFLYNTGSYQITIEHEGPNSSPGNRVHTLGLSNIVMGPREFVSLIPDASFGRIRSTR